MSKNGGTRTAFAGKVYKPEKTSRASTPAIAQIMIPKSTPAQFQADLNTQLKQALADNDVKFMKARVYIY